MRLALGAIVKNEAPYLIDWLAWHQALGFTDFIIADNDSTDGTTEILSTLDQAGMLTHIKFPNRLHKRPQLEAYDHMCRRLSGRVDWLALIDADEFIMPETPGDDLATVLRSMPQDTGAVTLNWAIFGSGGHLRAQGDPVFQRFQMRGKKSSDRNGFPYAHQHYKMIIRPQCYAKKIINPHHARLRNGFGLRRADGKALGIDQHGISTDIDWSRFRINHYATKSWSEFIQKKQSRGRADCPDLVRNSAYFGNHDLNDELDASAQQGIPKFDECKENILRALGESRRLYDMSVQNMVSFVPPEKPETFAGAIETSQASPRTKNTAARHLQKMKLRIIEAFSQMRIAR
ncbi:hypothetical protein AFEL58S_01427 [Afipia felis]